MRTLRRFVVLFVFVCCLASSIVSATPARGVSTDQWQLIGDPNPGETTDFMIDPENSNHLVVTSFYTSLKQSWDGGRTWEDVWVDNPRVKETNNMLTTNLYWVDGKWFSTLGM